MAQYLEFVIRDQNRFIMLDSFVRSSMMYQMFNAPYGKARPVTEQDFSRAREKAKAQIETFGDELARLQLQLTMMWEKAGAPLNEKREMSCEIQDDINGVQAELHLLREALVQINMFESFLDSLQIIENGEEVCTAVLYFGIDIESYEL